MFQTSNAPLFVFYLMAGKSCKSLHLLILMDMPPLEGSVVSRCLLTVKTHPSGLAHKGFIVALFPPLTLLVQPMPPLSLRDEEVKSWEWS